MEKHGWPLIRFVIPSYPEINIFTRSARKMTALGPIMVATSANKVWGWQVEVIDENNYKGPRGSQGLPDHQTLQKENPAAVVGFYCGLSSTMDRVFELARFYRQQEVFIIAGGWHTHYCPEEALNNNINVVVHGDGEMAIQQILPRLAEKKPIDDIPGISFLKEGKKHTNLPEMLAVPDLNNLPYQDLGLLKYPRKLRIFSLGRQRGCSMNCEFCSVKGKSRQASPEHLFSELNYLVNKWGGRKFFITDDRLEEDLRGTIEFFRLVEEKYGDYLKFVVQARLEAAKNTEFLEIMKKAGVKTVCIGYESPINEDLRAMRKGYRAADMIRWTKVYRGYGFKIHGMFIFGYPPKDGQGSLGPQEMTKRFKNFIREAKPNTIQILHPVPLVGTDLRQGLAGRVFPLGLVPWSRYDGSSVCFQPANMSLRELQEIPVELMHWFYNPWNFVKGSLKTFAFPVDYLLRGWQHWHRDWRRDWIRYGGYLLIQKWEKRQRKSQSQFLKKLEEYQRGEV